MTEDVADALDANALEGLLDEARNLAEDMTAIQVRHQRGSINDEEREADWKAATTGFYTRDERRDAALNGFLIVALSELAAWAWLEGRATTAEQ